MPPQDNRTNPEVGNASLQGGIDPQLRQEELLALHPPCSRHPLPAPTRLAELGKGASF